MAGLRERKKEKTRRSIQQEALKLFARQGYEATTVDQIAEAAEISPSTFFRYFATKEDVVIQDDYDPVMIEIFLAQPAGLNPVAALRRTLRELIDAMGPAEKEELLLRARLQLATPALRARLLTSQTSTVNTLSAAVAQRTGRDEDDLEVQAFTGAVIGCILPALARWVSSEGKASFPELAEICLAQLESGFANLSPGWDPP
ncbi:MAG TPA: TetR family transcriptional regulator [Candidatus Limnocylindrales bacterium]